MYNLKQIEESTWADRLIPHHFNNHVITGNRKTLFELLDVPFHVIPELLFTRQFIEFKDEIRTIQSLRSFNTLPRWLKKRMKFRLRHPHKFEVEAFHQSHGSTSVEKLNNMPITFNRFVERIMSNE